jgi:TonB-linked SusC/RagA family outer membrane protein
MKYIRIRFNFPGKLPPVCSPFTLLFVSVVLLVPIKGNSAVKGLQIASDDFFTIQTDSLKTKPKYKVILPLEVVSTGYQTLPKQRLTGSFSKPEKEMFNARIAPDILSKLNGITNGLIFNANTGYQADVNIRGRSTINSSDQPLLIVDDFPYYGDINQINPNDIASVTILKDAAAMSLWGVRGGNGVIVLNTKQAKKNRPIQVAANLNVTMFQIPDLSKNPNYMKAADFIEMEQFLYRNGKYKNDLSDEVNYPLISPAVEIMDKAAKGLLSSADSAKEMSVLVQRDIRKELKRNFYRHAVSQQYAVNLTGAGDNIEYYLSLGYDRHSGPLRFNTGNRTTFTFNQVLRPVKKLEITFRANAFNDKTYADKTLQRFVSERYSFYPYNQLADANGNPITVNRRFRNTYIKKAPMNRFQEWSYIPLQEFNREFEKSSGSYAKLGGSAKYSLLKELTAELLCQYQNIRFTGSQYKNSESFAARDLVNTFAVLTNGRVSGYEVPLGPIDKTFNTRAEAKDLRFQLNYSRSGQHRYFSAFTGFEISESNNFYYDVTSFGYPDQSGRYTYVDRGIQLPVNPAGKGTIEADSMSAIIIQRFTSLYAGFTYIFKDRYTLSGSARMDGSNYFSNQVNRLFDPFWSAGATWDISGEGFYLIKWLPVLKLAGSYGISGNLNKPAFLIPKYVNLPDLSPVGSPVMRQSNAENPYLKWETSKQVNAGIEFAAKDNIIRGSIEYYMRRGTDLIGIKNLDVTSGYSEVVTNFASMNAKGLDLSLIALILNRSLSWLATFNFNYTTDRITDYSEGVYISPYSTSAMSGQSITAVAGKPVFGVFGYKWAGLDENGNPMGKVNNITSTDYLRLTTPESLDELVYFGSARPKYFGGLTNRLRYKKIELQFNISYKMGYWFRRESIQYADLFNSYITHQDYAGRWQKPGDEKHTDVPSMQYPANPLRDAFYKNSEALIEKGDHIRLQDISLAYNFLLRRNDKAIRNMQLYLYANNIGLLWKANKYGIDPDYVAYSNNILLTPALRSISVGIKTGF